MRDFYHSIEHYRQLMIRNFPKYKIISFLKIIDFSETKEGNKKLKHAIKVYSKYKNLVVVAREKVSFDKMKKIIIKITLFCLLI